MLDPADAMTAAIRSAFDNYPMEGDPDWRGTSWILPDECTHLIQTILRALDEAGFQIVTMQTDSR
ncbi:hypothetical protein ACVWWG_005405 [Bradyrhizobium sp. LB7.2]